MIQSEQTTKDVQRLEALVEKIKEKCLHAKKIVMELQNPMTGYFNGEEILAREISNLIRNHEGAKDDSE